jgi:hypothetical protein
MTPLDGRRPGGSAAASAGHERGRRRIARSLRRARRSSPADTYRQLGALGLAPAEAANVAAYLIGLRPAAQGWRIEEIDRLLFLRHLVTSGRIES